MIEQIHEIKVLSKCLNNKKKILMHLKKCFVINILFELILLISIYFFNVNEDFFLLMQRSNYYFRVFIAFL